MAEYHAKRFARIDGVRVVAVGDRDQGRADRFAAAQGLGAAFDEVSRLCDPSSVDAVAICSRDGWHRAPVLAALERGLPVFCEKPMARRLEEAEEMVLAAKRAGVPALVNFSKRNGGLLSLAKSLVEAGRLGRILGAELSYLQSWVLQDSWGDWRSSPRWRWRLDEGQSTYGALGDLGSHLFDAATLLLGGFEAAACLCRRFEDPEAGALLPGGAAWESFCALGGAGDIPVVLRGSFRSRGKLDAFGLVIRGELADLLLDFDVSRDSLRLAEGGEAWRELQARPEVSSYERFVALARGGVDPLPDPIDFDQGLRVQRLVDGAAKSAAGRELGSAPA